jgi:hypothetical protein
MAWWWTIVQQYRVPGIHILDLIEEGNAGLTRAAGAFDPVRGYKFSTVFDLRHILCASFLEWAGFTVQLLEFMRVVSIAARQRTPSPQCNAQRHACSIEPNRFHAGVIPGFEPRAPRAALLALATLCASHSGKHRTSGRSRICRVLRCLATQRGWTPMLRCVRGVVALCPAA